MVANVTVAVGQCTLYVGFNITVNVRMPMSRQSVSHLEHNGPKLRSLAADYVEPWMMDCIWHRCLLIIPNTYGRVALHLRQQIANGQHQVRDVEIEWGPTHCTRMTLGSCTVYHTSVPRHSHQKFNSPNWAAYTKPLRLNLNQTMSTIGIPSITSTALVLLHSVVSVMDYCAPLIIANRSTRRQRRT